ncbi:hypothetical protein FKW77_009736 [Venturia effusa]|uniref:Amino acid permease/ SLC12A domain-containing protein n=1 Tax=Venturia effusa TaxID=50376 RepID=A0A517L242_9PEZI|nr:hypothetical protein FKW77_009736 [Venturia effusa]
MDISPDNVGSKELHHEVFKEVDSSTDSPRVTMSTEADVRDMSRLGKDQQFNRIFRQSTMIMFTSMIQGTWEVVLLANTGGLVNGGLAGMFWGYIWTFAGFFSIVMSLAEMASMAPTSGGQHHWVSEFAPRKHQRFLSYMSGWMSTLSWQAGTAGSAFIMGVLIQGCVVGYHPTYSPKRWQGTLFVFAFSAVQGIVNTFLAAQLPRIQKVMIVPHAFGWIAVIIVLAALAPHASAKDVFTNFSSNEGWEPIGVSLMVGQINSVYLLILSDSAAHLSEEVKDAAKSVPRAMMWSFVLNGTVGFFVLVAFLFAIPDISAALSPETNPSGFTFLYVFQKASYHGSIPLTLILIFVALAGGIDSNCTTSRQLFAFARDGGFPLRSWLVQVHNRTVPRNAVIMTCTISVLLSLINLGSTVAFNAIISLQLLALMSTYFLSIGCVFYQRLFGGPQSLPPAKWSLGRYGIFINGFGTFYTFFILFWAGWPASRHVTPKTFNWGPVMFAAVFLFSLVYFVAFGKKSYQGPVVLVKQLSM